MDAEVLKSIIQWAVWGIALSLTMYFTRRWIARRRHRSRVPSDPGRLVYPRSILILGLIGSGLFLGLVIISNTIAKNETTTIWTTLGFFGFSLLGFLFILIYFFGWCAISEDGMNYARFLRPHTLKWNEVTSVRYSARLGRFAIRTRSGAVANISVMLVGLPEFAKLVLSKASAATIDFKTRQALEAAVDDKLPSIGGYSDW